MMQFIGPLEFNERQVSHVMNIVKESMKMYLGIAKCSPSPYCQSKTVQVNSGYYFLYMFINK